MTTASCCARSGWVPWVMPRIFSGIQPSGELHIGSYLGAVQNWVRLQASYECLFAIVVLHAITMKHDPVTLPRRPREMPVALPAAGNLPARANFFVQSH